MDAIRHSATHTMPALTLRVKCSLTAALELAARGEAKAVDLLVSDIYGGGLEEHGLPGDIVAASFGKLTNPDVRSYILHIHTFVHMNILRYNVHLGRYTDLHQTHS